MRKIASPTTEKHPDRLLALQEAMADAVSDVCLSAIRAGWEPAEVAAALVELADTIMIGMIASRDADRKTLRHLRK